MTRTTADRGLLAELAGHIVFFRLYYNFHIDILAAVLELLFSTVFYSFWGEEGERSDSVGHEQYPSTGNFQSSLMEEE